MKEDLFSILINLEIDGESMKDKVYLQGTIDIEEEYPKTFITFFTSNTQDRSFYDDKLVTEDWEFSVILYSDDPFIVEEGRTVIVNALKRHGFLPQGKGHDIPSDIPEVTGWAMDFIATEHIH